MVGFAPARIVVLFVGEVMLTAGGVFGDCTVMVPTNPEHSPEQISDIIHNIGIAARVALGGMALDEADLRNVPPIDIQKFDAISRDRAEARGGHPSQPVN